MTTSLRDVSAAQMVNALAEVGYFDNEYNVYGCAFWYENKVHYIVSDDYNAICNFKKKAVWEDIYASPVWKREIKDSFLEGMERRHILKLKLELAKELYNAYPASYFKERVAENYQDSAYDILKDWQQEIDGYFDEDELILFEEAVRCAYQGHKITPEHMKSFRFWIKHVRMQMTENIEKKDRFSRTLYGFAYENEGKILYVSNANQKVIYERKEEVVAKGLFVTPIFEKEYWYHQSEQLYKLRGLFEENLKSIYNKRRIKEMKKILL
ncbi:MAG: hypothetical protein UDB11_03825 [Peptococcaceae bacterium]|nr:hypothetical protein [Peptococcaceae bacterium]